MKGHSLPSHRGRWARPLEELVQVVQALQIWLPCEQVLLEDFVRLLFSVLVCLPVVLVLWEFLGEVQDLPVDLKQVHSLAYETDLTLLWMAKVHLPWSVNLVVGLVIHSRVSVIDPTLQTEQPVELAVVVVLQVYLPVSVVVVN